jgi:CheY-like chemotaxis protein
MADEEIVRGFARRALEYCGYTILETANGREALALRDDRGPGSTC